MVRPELSTWKKNIAEIEENWTAKKCSSLERTHMWIHNKGPPIDEKMKYKTKQIKKKLLKHKRNGLKKEKVQDPRGSDLESPPIAEIESIDPSWDLH